MSPLEPELRRDLANLAARGLLRRLRAIDSAPDTLLLVDGKTVLNFSSNNPLALAHHPELRASAQAALHSHGTGAAAARLIAGNLTPHRELERALASWLGTEAALLFNSGYQANVGTVSALVGPEDAIYSDQLNHASLIDGCRLSGATIHVYPHRDAAALARLLAQGQGRFRRRLLLSESLFSMDGDLAPLGALRDLAHRYDAILMVDEAHAAGVRGPAGRGLAAELGVPLDICVGTLSKAFGSFGAYVAGSAALVEYLTQCARSFVFTTALPPAVAAASHAAVTLAAGAEGTARRAQLQQVATRFADGLAALGLPAPRGRWSHIVPIVIGDATAAMHACEALLERGIFAQGIRPPTVPRGTARLRFALSSGHTDPDIERALAALADIRGLLP